MDNRTGKRHDAKGRSTGEVRHFGGRAKSWKFEEAFVGEPMSLLESPAYRALNFPALKILGFLKLEHVRHGGAENGRLLAPYRQLEALSISARHVKPALAMLEALGIIRVTSDGSRMGGRPNAAKYALTWLPTCDGALPTADYRRVTEAEAKAYRPPAPRRKTEAAFLRAVDAPSFGKLTGAETVETACLKEGDTACPKEGTIYILGGCGTAKAEKPLSKPPIPKAVRNGADCAPSATGPVAVAERPA